MHRIDGTGATADNRFTEGDPSTGVEATVVTDDWLNGVQEEIANAIEAESITLAKGTWDQLANALKKGNTRPVFDMASLMNEGPLYDGRQVALLGFYSAGDGGGGELYWDSGADKANHNGGTIIDPDHSASPGDNSWYSAENTGSGCWKLIYSGFINIRNFGALGDNSAQDIPIQKAIDEFEGSLDGPIIFLPPGRYTITSLLTVDLTLSIWGAGRDKTQLKGADDTVSIFQMLDRNINIKDLEISGGHDGVIVGDSSGTKANYSIISNLFIESMAGTGILFEGGNFVRFEYISSQNCDIGFHVTNNTNNKHGGSIIGCDSFDCTSYGMYVQEYNDADNESYQMQDGVVLNFTDQGSDTGVHFGANRSEAIVYTEGNATNSVIIPSKGKGNVVTNTHEEVTDNGFNNIITETRAYSRYRIGKLNHKAEGPVDAGGTFNPDVNKQIVLNTSGGTRDHNIKDSFDKGEEITVINSVDSSDYIRLEDADTGNLITGTIAPGNGAKLIRSEKDSGTLWHTMAITNDA